MRVVIELRDGRVFLVNGVKDFEDALIKFKDYWKRNIGEFKETFIVMKEIWQEIE